MSQLSACVRFARKHQRQTCRRSGNVLIAGPGRSWAPAGAWLPQRLGEASHSEAAAASRLRYGRCPRQLLWQPSGSRRSSGRARGSLQTGETSWVQQGRRAQPDPAHVRQTSILPERVGHRWTHGACHIRGESRPRRRRSLTTPPGGVVEDGTSPGSVDGMRLRRCIGAWHINVGTSGPRYQRVGSTLPTHRAKAPIETTLQRHG
mmetsp:Transcript_57084/g.90533  ORF Transcript_57084/g.90533 Transcript_57084/m.90533 type:complete len:205 (+) Transcript_57084:874-1488(+)